MRFKKIEHFPIDNLHLDQGNYRFKKALDQNDCIQKIFGANPDAFRNLMVSIAEDDLGEALLAYRTPEGEIVVLDGNRRLSALKVLHNPSLAPNGALRAHADKLARKHDIDFDEIHAQVSDDRSLIMKTVYERHASGKGKARINWSAYAAARFRFLEEASNESSDEWKATALLLEAESRNPELTSFLEGARFSFETYRRIAIRALHKDKNIIAASIFSNRDRRIKKSAPKGLLDDAIKNTERFIEAVKTRELSLSRGKSFADADNVEKFLSQFLPEPTPGTDEGQDGDTDNPNELSEGPSGSDGAESSGEAAVGSSSGEHTGLAATDGDDTNSGQSSNDTNAQPDTKRTVGMGGSRAITKKLEEFNNQKLIQLYDSICTVPMRHSTLLHVAVWAFYESLGRAVKPDANDSRGLIGNLMKDEFGKAGRRPAQAYKDYTNRVGYIFEFGDCLKHSSNVLAASVDQLKADMKVLEPVVIMLIDKAIEQAAPSS